MYEHADGIVLSIYDFLRNTKADELNRNASHVLDDDAFHVLAEGCRIALDDTTTDRDEAAWLTRCLEAGWNLAPAPDNPPARS
jgi:hypothetical protein